MLRRAAVTDGWAVPDWTLAPALAALEREIKARWPRTTVGEGASSGHVANSDHYPDANGVVNAIDVMTGPGAPDGDRLVAQLVGDDRLSYVIWNRTIWSKSHGWAPRPYDGPSPHTDHVHVSLDHSGPAGGGAVQGQQSGIRRFLPDLPGLPGLPDLNPFDNLAGALGKLLIMGVVLAGGAALVVLGVNRGVQPAVRKVMQV